MSLIDCPECQEEISDKADSCPACGFPVESLHQDEGRSKPANKTETLKDDKDSNKPENLSFPLYIGIAAAPFLFSWFTLSKSHEIRTKVIAFTWLILYSSVAIGITLNIADESQIENQSSQTEWEPYAKCDANFKFCMEEAANRVENSFEVDLDDLDCSQFEESKIEQAHEGNYYGQEECLQSCSWNPPTLLECSKGWSFERKCRAKVEICQNIWKRDCRTEYKTCVRRVNRNVKQAVE